MIIKRKRHLSTIILVELLVIVAAIFLISAQGSYRYLAFKSRKMYEDTMKLYTEKDIQYFEDNRKGSLEESIDEYLNEDISTYQFGETGYILRADENLVIIGSNRTELIGKTLPEAGFPVEKGGVYSQTFSAVVEGEKVCAYGDNSAGFFIFYVMPLEEVDTDPSETARIVIVTMILVCLALYIGATVLIRKNVVKSINSLTGSLSRITEGNLDERVDIRSSIEFDSLSDNVNATVDRLKGLIEEESRRIDEELDFARITQSSSLPSVSALSARKEIDIDAYMGAARQVGGDFYDFFLIGENRLGIVIADVSGKGISAALFMMRSEAFIRNRALHGGTPAEILEDVNGFLCEGNESLLFVTVWFAILDLETGKGMAVKAGHTDPVFRRGSESFETVKSQSFLVLGAMKGVRYENTDFEMNPGDCVFVYTDGVTEAMDKDGELFGKKRMLAALNRDPHSSVRQLIKNVRADVSDFVGEADQFDDITMLCLEYIGKKGDVINEQ
ncbi:MAG: SpoIIE family protein phosphatase [Blautia sp.]|nr:SpoIIE family protein phosphatase [Blautia sp.]